MFACTLFSKVNMRTERARRKKSLDRYLLMIIHSGEGLQNVRIERIICYACVTCVSTLGQRASRRTSSPQNGLRAPSTRKKQTLRQSSLCASDERCVHRGICLFKDETNTSTHAHKHKSHFANGTFIFTMEWIKSRSYTTCPSIERKSIEHTRIQEVSSLCRVCVYFIRGRTKCEKKCFHFYSMFLVRIIGFPFARCVSGILKPSAAKVRFVCAQQHIYSMHYMCVHNVFLCGPRIINHCRICGRTLICNHRGAHARRHLFDLLHWYKMRFLLRMRHDN